MIEVDGSYGEGGGQLVRLAVSLAALTGKAVRIDGVRAKRGRPGLAAQHLAAVRAVAALCEARCGGLELRSTRLSFEPRSPARGGELRVEVGTAGSVTLVLQALLPIQLGTRAASRVTVAGGTDVRRAPTWDYFREVLLRLLARMGAEVGASVARRGYYPRGGGEVALEVRPGALAPLVLREPARGWRIAGEAQVANLPIAIAERMRAAALAALATQAAIGVQSLGRGEALGAGGALTLWAESAAGVLGASSVAERGVRAETLGAQAGGELAADLASGATLDVHAADQILVYMAMAPTGSSFTCRSISSHASTAMWLLPQFLPVRFSVEPQGGLWRVSSERC